MNEADWKWLRGDLMPGGKKDSKNSEICGAMVRDSTRADRSFEYVRIYGAERSDRTSQAWNSYQGSRWSDNCWNFREDKRWRIVGQTRPEYRRSAKIAAYAAELIEADDFISGRWK